ncbi:hypothetical protein AVEN_75452-1 [Araneus ventricosus]|uniref:Mos1 transposase HTH domain-containing protein n=1 Tax=Araneus ventricosus TaxID=182803 RepID=A0A4Y2UFK4_ARAVE|nr:hypothetical protein AVEN_75452-1 [Araneus ventricosus]
MLYQVYRTDAVSRKCVYDWFKHFREEKETMDNAPHSGRPSTSVTTDNIERVRQTLLQNRRLSLRWISEELEINKDSVSTIIHKDLGKYKICSHFMPHSLTDEHPTGSPTVLQEWEMKSVSR